MAKWQNYVFIVKYEIKKYNIIKLHKNIQIITEILYKRMKSARWVDFNKTYIWHTSYQQIEHVKSMKKWGKMQKNLSPTKIMLSTLNFDVLFTCTLLKLLNIK